MDEIPIVQVGTGNEFKVVEPVLLVGLDENGNLVPLKCDANGILETS